MTYVQHATVYTRQLWTVTTVIGIFKQLSRLGYDESITNLKNAICLRQAEAISQYC